MIEYISGEVVELTPASVVIETAGGVGYFLNISLNTFSALKQGEKKRLYVHEAIREDAYTLYGFNGRKERELFQMLISVSGVGPNTARMILSGLSPTELEQVVATENVALLKSVKGIGAKTAQRIIVDLRDKIKSVGSPLVSSMPQVSATYEEAVAALSMLGFAPQASQKVVQKLLQDMPGIRVEEVIKQALKML
jgi:Holliday junction DNA helicase RuvA